MATDFRDVKDDARDRLASDFKELKQNFAQFRDDVGAILKNAVGVGRSNARAARDSASSTASSYADTARDTASSYYGQARDTAASYADQAKERFDDYRARGQEHVENVGEQISEHPLTAAAIAFGVGFVIAKILTKR